MGHSPSVMDRAKTQIVLDHPFFASILLRYPLKAREDIKTLAVSNRGVIYYNPKFVESLSVPQAVFGLCHEVMHVVCQHATRLHGRKQRVWNIAGDAVINDTLKAARIGEPIENIVDMPGSKDRTTDAVYDDLLKQEPPPPDNPKPGDNDGSGGNQGGSGDDRNDGIGDDIIEEGGPLTESEARELEAEAKVCIAQAQQAAKSRGRMPGALAAFVNTILDSRVPWFDILERHMVAFTKGDYSWSRPNRRYVSAGIYLPSVGRIPRMGEVVIVGDISGSVSQPELAHFGGHIARIIEQCVPEKVHMLYVDTRVQRHDTFGPDDEVKIDFYSGGGTHMPAAFDYCAKEGIVPEVMVFLTDGETDYGQPPGYPVIWCISSDRYIASHGETVPFRVEV